MVTYQDCKNCERKQEMEKTGYMCIGCIKAKQEANCK